MKKRSVYNPGFNNQINQEKKQEEVIVFGEECKFENTIEARIFDIKVDIDDQNQDYDTVAFLCNFKVVNINDEDGNEKTVLMLVMQDRRGRWFTCYYKYNPYFLIKCKQGYENDVIGYLEKRFQNEFQYIKIIDKVDLSELNHLSGEKRKYLQINFSTIQQYNIVKRQLQQKLSELKNKYRPKQRKDEEQERIWKNQIEGIEDLYEYDVSYSARVCIDNDIRVSNWYDIKTSKQFITKIQRREDFVEKPEFTILAFDIETTKAPLKFPDPDIDCIIMISYVIDEQAFLIVNREICSQDVKTFNYNPKDNINTDVIIYNEQNEKECLKKFFSHIQISKPFLLVTFNGDFFDIPFIKHRAKAHDMELLDCIGLEEQRNGSFIGKYVFLHMDCFYWVKRDAFLPHGSHGLKAVTKKKLGYTPIEVDPEEMVQMAKNDPQKLCEYSVSDAVATYYLYMQNIHDYIFALCTIIPMNPDDVLRRGSGTLCEHLLMARAFQSEIVFPNKQKQTKENFYKGHPIESETYVGGYVECLNNGIYRADIKTKFQLNAEEYERQIMQVYKVLEFYVKIEKGIDIEEIENMNEIKVQIQDKLQQILQKIKDNKNDVLEILPLIYHIDVSSMYPNIILTNRLQPTAIVGDKICSNCVFNEPKNNCKRVLGWDWKVTYYPISQPEYEKLKFENDNQNLKKAIKTYSQKHYKTMHQQIKQYKEDVVCMRENPFYVDTIRDFRDRRIRFKVLAGKHKKQIQDNEQNKMLAVYYDSLQLAHKIILNSFYGYVMKKGARWYSMEMAAMVTYTGAKIIQESRKLMDLLGKPLELDTDGIWTLLPKGFPENFELKCKDGRKLYFSYPCSLMNWIIYDKFKNTQYQTLEDKEDRTYNVREEMSIFFEIDGPYKAIVIPAAREENKKLKKRYCVFDFKGKITEIKGFEIKRRGELGLVKNFQEEIFYKFLEGNNMKELYQSCANTVRKWLKVITEKGKNMTAEKILEQLSQLKVLSRSLSQYSSKKSVAITAAQRLFEMIGTELGDTQGLNCNFIISKKPESAQLSQRAIPTMVFQLPINKRNEYLRRWLQVSNPEQENLITVLDWDYYYERFIHIVQKIVTIPAVLQGLENPLPEIVQPDWLEKRLYKKIEKEKQSNLQNFFEKVPKTIEEIDQLAKDIKIKQNQKMIVKQKEDNIQEVAQEIKSLRLAVLKKKWKQERQQKKQFSLDKIQMRTEDLQAYTQQLDQRVRKVPWQIISIDQMEDGWLKYWLLIDGKVMVDRKIHIQRKIYVNSLQNDTQQISIQSKKSLPREKQSQYLYEYKIEEEQYKEKLTMMDYYSTNPMIEGVYETQVSLKFRASVYNGNYCKLKNYGNKTNQFDIEQLQKQNGQNKYLIRDENFQSKLNLIYLWGVDVNGKYLVMLFTENLLTVFKYQNNREQKKLGSQYKNFVKESILKIYGKESKILNTDYLQIDYQFYDDQQQFNNAVFNSIIDFKVKFKNKAFLTIIDTKIKQLNKYIEQIKMQIPILQLESEEFLEQMNYSSLDWHFVMVEYGLVNFQVLQKRLYQLDQLSAFCEIPICSLDGYIQNSILKAIDTCFARELDKNFCVWWYSLRDYPDLGLSEEKQQIENIVQDENLQCEFSRSFISDNYVIEIDIGMFHFNALICSEDFQNINTEIHLQKKQNKKNRDFFQKSHTSNNIGFKILKDLFLSWYKQVTLEKNVTANLLLQNIVRWLCSSNSYFFDPLLKENLDKIVKKFFDEFLKQLEDMGAIIIYANPNKLFISTRKYSYHQAVNFVQFILQSLVQGQKFSYLLLKISKVYKLLVFKDRYNFTGVTVDGEENDELQKKNINLHQQWKVKQFFPPIVQNYFDLVFKNIMSKFYEYSKEAAKIPDFKQKQKLQFLYDKMEHFLTNDFSSQMYELIGYMKQQERLNDINKLERQKNKEHRKKRNQNINNEQSQDEYENDSFLVDDQEELDGGILAQLQRKEKNIESDNESVEDKYEQWDRPNLPGKKQECEYMVLEFLHVLFDILTVERHYMANIFDNLKKEFLDHINLPITQEEYQYKQFLVKFQIQDVICESCYLVRNIDLFQEFYYNQRGYYCVCGSLYDQIYIQQQIVNLLKSFQQKYVQPQIYCVDCRNRKHEYMKNTCNCGSKYKEDKDNQMNEYIEEMQRNFQSFKDLSTQCDYEILSDYLKNFIQQLI